MLDRIAVDLGIYRFVKEPLLQYQNRVIYSALACWIKAIALDRPVAYKDKEAVGVSRRHIYDRGRIILGMMTKMFPETREWFDLSADKDDPVNLIRTRLINHGDLLNSGFDTNLALSSVHSKQITSTIEAIFGKTIDKGIYYSGVASIRIREKNVAIPEIENVKKWMNRFLNDASWFHDMPDPSQMQYYNPLCSAKNNYSAWQDSMEGVSDKVILVRTVLNKNSYSYYLLKPKETLIHRIDPFLQEQGYHIRVMCALRSQLKNNTTISVAHYTDHVRIRFNALLPLRENNLMESYAWPVQRINDKLEWVMSVEIWNYIKPYIEALDILTLEEKHG